jgi:hypothetical protein
MEDFSNFSLILGIYLEGIGSLKVARGSLAVSVLYVKKNQNKDYVIIRKLVNLTQVKIAFLMKYFKHKIRTTYSLEF